MEPSAPWSPGAPTDLLTSLVDRIESGAGQTRPRAPASSSRAPSSARASLRGARVAYARTGQGAEPDSSPPLGRTSGPGQDRAQAHLGQGDEDDLASAARNTSPGQWPGAGTPFGLPMMDASDPTPIPSASTPIGRAGPGEEIPTPVRTRELHDSVPLAPLATGDLIRPVSVTSRGAPLFTGVQPESGASLPAFGEHVELGEQLADMINAALQSQVRRRGLG